MMTFPVKFWTVITHVWYTVYDVWPLNIIEILSWKPTFRYGGMSSYKTVASPLGPNIVPCPIYIFYCLWNITPILTFSWLIFICVRNLIRRVLTLGLRGKHGNLTNQ